MEQDSNAASGLSYDKPSGDQAVSPPQDRFHNQPETGALGLDEVCIIEAGRTAIHSLQKTLDLWLTIGEAIKVLRRKADLDGRRQTFKRLLRQNGFAMEGPDKVIDPGMVTKLLKVLEHKAAVMAWHEKLTPKQKREWAAPNTIMKHCPTFKREEDDSDSADKRLTPAQQTNQALAKALEEIEQLKKQKADERFTPTDTAEDVATTIVCMFSPRKVEDICHRALAKLKARR